MKAAGQNVLSFGTGEPDFPAPSNIVEAAHQAALGGETTYPPTQGTPTLREAIARDVVRHSGFSPEIDEIIVSTGAKQVLSNAFLATLDPGDGVIVPAPYWASYADIINVCQATMVSMQCAEDNGFRLTSEDLASAITPKTRWLMLNTPGNPSGAMYSGAELAALAEVLRSYPHVWVIADEIYQHIAYDRFISFRASAPDLADRTLIVNGVSKAYAMTGWRIGWGIGPAPLIRTMVAIQGQSTSGACSISQAAAVAAFTGPQDVLAERCDELRKRRDFVAGCLNDIALLSRQTPGGAFYVFPSCTGTFGLVTPDGDTIKSDGDFCRYILRDALVALVPGCAFGLPGYFRLSYAYSSDDLTEGCRRIAAVVTQLTPRD